MFGAALAVVLMLSAALVPSTASAGTLSSGSSLELTSLQPGTVTVLSVCPTCKGSGIEVCPLGAMIPWYDGSYWSYRTCWSCGGRGSYTCRTCGGIKSGGTDAANSAPPAVGVTSIVRTPSKAKPTYRRKKGKARFTLSAAVRGADGTLMSGVAATLQTSKNGKKGWKNSYKLATNEAGVASKSFTVKKKSTVYYRWVAGDKKTSVQRVIVK
jgi:hypothetical protein